MGKRLNDSNTRPNKSEREIVLDILVEHEVHGTYSNVLIRNAQDRYASLPLTQRSFIKRLAEGTIEREIELDRIIRDHQKNPDVPLKPVIRCLLRMSIYQIYYMDSVPDFAACNEAVRICRKRHLDSQAGFVNGVLRAVCREKVQKTSHISASEKERVVELQSQTSRKQIILSDTSRIDLSSDRKRPQSSRQPDLKQGQYNVSHAERISETYSIPVDIVNLWLDQLGEGETESLCRSLLEVRPVCIRLNALLSSGEKQEVLAALSASGTEVLPGRWAPDCYYLKHASRLADLAGFRDGKWTVQDESSQLVAQAAGLEKFKSGVDTSLLSPTSMLRTGSPISDSRDDRSLQIYDLCAAPGGKTMLAAGLVPDGHVYSFDLSRKKTDLIRSNLGRMHLHNVTVAENDASNYNPDLDAKGDIVLCDVPCSGLGVMTKKRDIKYNFSLQKVRSLAALQKKIVTNACSVVKPGGILIYSTCTINRLENEKMADFIAKIPGMVPEPLAPFLPEGFPGIEDNHVQMLPNIHGTDGFFIARFRRRK